MDIMQNLKIPVLPLVVSQVIKFDYSNPESGVRDMEAIIKADKSISMDLLKISNSAFYGRSGKVKTLLDALALLGLKSVKNLVIFIGTNQVNAGLKDKLVKKYINEYAISTAIIASEIGQKFFGKEVGEEAFLGGLIHKVGMNIIALNRKEYPLLLAESEKGTRKLKDLEKKEYGVTHAEIGARVIQEWQLPASFQEVVSIESSNGESQVKTEIGAATLLGAVISARMLGIPSSAEPLKLAETLKTSFRINPALIEKMLQPAYHATVKAHPCFQMVTL